MSERLKVGLDFGTSNSAIATAKNGEITIFRDEEGNLSQPSSIFISVDGQITTGFEAVEEYLKPDKNGDTTHIVPAIKRGLALDFYEGNILESKKVAVNGRRKRTFFPVEEMCAQLMRDLKKRAEATTQKEATGVVVGRPVNFSEDETLDKLAQRRLERAATIAGFHNISFLLEPVAAALYFETQNPSDTPRKLFVFDFGGGTLDVSVVGLERSNAISPNTESSVLATHGIDLGGTDLDKDVFNALFLEYFGSKVIYGHKQLPMPIHLYGDLTEWHLHETTRTKETINVLKTIALDPFCSDEEAVNRLITLVRDQKMYSILRRIEAAKIGLTTQERTDIRFRHKQLELDSSLTQDEYERIIRSRVEEIQDCIQECLRKAQLEPKEIDVVLKTGGSSNNGFVDALLGNIFTGNIRSSDIFTSVVSGLAIAAENTLGD
jgi:hypothetical chaperone protein